MARGDADTDDDLLHPRFRHALFGHDAAEEQIVSALRDQRLHHAWLITGPEGIGKATLAYRMARHILAHGTTPPASALDLSADHPVSRQIAAQAHPDLFVLERVAEAGKDKKPQTIPVDQVRKVSRFFSGTAADGGYRIAIVDSADELNNHGANALLKIIEEPPQRALVLIISHVPGRLPPTIRSRCRVLPLKSLSDSDIHRALAALPLDDGAAVEAAIPHADGSVAQALRLSSPANATFVAALDKALSHLPRRDDVLIDSVTDRLSARDDAQFDLFLLFVKRHLDAQLLRRAGEGAYRLAPLAEVWEKTDQAARDTRALNLDRKLFAHVVFGWLAGL